jgi:hypothetical protein
MRQGGFLHFLGVIQQYAGSNHCGGQFLDAETASHGCRIAAQEFSATFRSAHGVSVYVPNVSPKVSALGHWSSAGCRKSDSAECLRPAAPEPPEDNQPASACRAYCPHCRQHVLDATPAGLPQTVLA